MNNLLKVGKTWYGQTKYWNFSEKRDYSSISQMVTVRVQWRSLRNNNEVEWAGTVVGWINEMQIKVILRFHLTPFRMKIIKTRNVGDDLGKKKWLYTVGTYVN
jgi:hypothetical protein